MTFKCQSFVHFRSFRHPRRQSNRQRSASVGPVACTHQHSAQNIGNVEPTIQDSEPKKTLPRPKTGVTVPTYYKVFAFTLIIALGKFCKNIKKELFGYIFVTAVYITIKIMDKINEDKVDQGFRQNSPEFMNIISKGSVGKSF